MAVCQHLRPLAYLDSLWQYSACVTPPSPWHALIEGVISDITGYIVEDRNIEFDDALKIFVQTQTFEKLSDTKTGLYRESAAYTYEILKSELEDGKIT